MPDIRTTKLPSGEAVPVLGQGTWHMGENSRHHAEEVAALKLGIDLGVTLVDTAEMYGSGGAETVVADAIAGQRDKIFIVSKVLPSNASRRGVETACEKSLRRLKVETIDLYLLHWRGSVPLAETVDAFEALKGAGKIRHWGVSNFDADDMQELDGHASGKAVQTNQVLYNPRHRGIEHDLMPWCRKRGIPLMAYSPVGQGGALLRNPGLQALAGKRRVTPAQIVLAWSIRTDGVITIPKATQPAHIRENRAAADLTLSPDELAEIDRLFAPPAGKQPLEMI
jgi:diketogulonate reductase-like aldo/keto reductase